MEVGEVSECPYCHTIGLVEHVSTTVCKSATEHDFRCRACGEHWTEIVHTHEDDR